MKFFYLISSYIFLNLLLRNRKLPITSPGRKQLCKGFWGAYIQGSLKKVFQNKLHNSADQNTFWIMIAFLNFKMS